MIRWLKRRFRNRILPVNDLLPLVPKSTRLFDVGCGQGQFLKAVAQHCSPVALAGLEIDEQLIESGRADLQSATSVPVKLEVYDGARLPLSVSNYDIISVIDVLHHIPAATQEVFIGDLFAGMHSGALLLLKDIDAGRPLLCAFNKLHDLVLSGGMGAERSRDWTADVLSKTGFRAISSGERRMLVYPHYWFLAVKP